MNHLARWMAIVVLLLPLLMLPITWRTPRVGFYHSLIVVLESNTGTITLTKWEWYNGQDLATRLQLYLPTM